MSENRTTILPTERVSRTSRARIIVTIVAVLLSAVAVNEGIKILFDERPELANITYVAFFMQWQRLATLDEPLDTLIIGDSSGRHGVDPEILDDVLGGYSQNYCTMGGAAVINPAWQLESYLQRHGPPRRVILVAVHDLWRRGIELPLMPLVPLPWGFWERMQATMPLGRTETREIFLARHVPVYSQDKTVTDLLLYPWHPRKPIYFSDRGFSAIRKPDPEKAIEDGANHLKWRVPAGWAVSGQSDTALASMVELADEYGFDLYLANSPQLASMMEDAAFSAYYDTGQEYLAKMADRSRHVHVILDPPATYPPELMQNSDHIAIDAVENYTRRLAEAIAAVESGRSIP